MNRTTVLDAKNSRLPEALNIPPTDSRFLQYVNESTERLLHRGLFWGTYGRWAINITSQLLTLPAEIDTVEKVSQNNIILPLHDLSYEFLGNGWGDRDDTTTTGINEALYRGNFPTYTDIPSGSPTVLNVKCDVAADVGTTVTLFGYDTNSNWVRTQVAGVWQNGETVALAQGAGTNTTTVFSRVTAVQIPGPLKGQWWLYSGTTLLANYQYWETNPSYKRYLIPFVDGVTTNVIVMAKRSFIPVSQDSDFLIIGNLSALKLACMAIKAEEEHNWGEATLLWNGGTDKNGNVRMGAIQELQAELDHHTGKGTEYGITVRGSSVGENEPVEALL